MLAAPRSSSSAAPRSTHRAHRVGATPAGPRDEATLLMTALRRLPADLQMTLELRLCEGFESDQIAEALRQPIATVRRRLWLGEQQLCALVNDISPSKALARSVCSSLPQWGRHVQRTLLAGAVRPVARHWPRAA